MGIRSTVLSLEADGLVDHQVARARVDGSGDGESNDDACDNDEYGSSKHEAGRTAAAYRGAAARGGSASGGGDAAKRCALWFDGVCVSLHVLHDPVHSSSLMLSSGLSSPNGLTYQTAPPSAHLGLALTQSIKTDARNLPALTGIGRIMRAVGRNIRRDRVANILNSD